MPVYFAQLPTGSIKIGCAGDVDLRLCQLTKHYKQPLSLLHVMEGDLQTEREIHERFAHLRFNRTEQFRPDADLMEFIGKPLLVSANAEVVEAPRAFIFVKSVAFREVVKAARIVCAYRGMTLAAYMSGLLAPLVSRDLADEQRKAQGPAARPKGGK